MSAKAVVGRALRETGAALKQASGAEVRPFLVVMVVVVLGYLLHGDQSGAVLDGGRTKVYVLIWHTDEEYVVLVILSSFRLVLGRVSVSSV